MNEDTDNLPGAYRKDESGSWAPIPHNPIPSPYTHQIDAARLAEALAQHRYEDAPPPGLYPDQPTVCSCNASPPGPGRDHDWWIEHLLTAVTA
jgi:hypothetical protein